ncbi:4-hydroxybenzoate polyprenyltransferase, mitochondrial [Platysternon megacephalum]|uniref:4-hydroxybenzoate polyprenyltransferase, mitochondrial n=1 Tax=Platysternon megacephalum TaxID=55544 RepID=A0A4D9E9H3_9SAUR|nr:4-hydroxybenzoate polyprenyltransferase, mitochondrial [Platysternon megacephalum]
MGQQGWGGGDSFWPVGGMGACRESLEAEGRHSGSLCVWGWKEARRPCSVQFAQPTAAKPCDPLKLNYNMNCLNSTDGKRGAASSPTCSLPIMLYTVSTNRKTTFE